MTDYPVAVTAVGADGVAASATATITTTTTDPWAALDGRANAPAGAPQLPSILNAYTPARRPPWQVAGVHYRVGPNGNPVKNPALISMAGVSLNTGSRSVVVGGNNVVLDGYDFSIGGGWQIAITGNNCTISNSKFGGSILGAYMVYAPTGTNTVTVKYCEFDGSGNANVLVAGLRSSAVGVTTFMYNYVHHYPSHFFELTQDNGTANFSVIQKFNLISTGATKATEHLNFLQFGGGHCTSVDCSFNCCYQPRQISGGEGFQFYPNTDGGIIAGSVMANNTMLAVGGPTGSSMSYMVHGGHGFGGEGGILRDNYMDLTAAYGAFYGDEGGYTITGNKSLVTGKTINRDNTES